MKFRRKDLKRDRFVEEVSHQVVFIRRHRKQFVAGAIVLVVVLVTGTGYWTYNRQQQQASQAALYDAIQNFHGIVSDEPSPGSKTFSQESDRIQESEQSLNKVTLEFSNAQGATGAMYYLGLLDLEQGNRTEAISHFEQAARGSSAEYSALAKFSLGTVLLQEGDVDAAREHFQHLVENPTRTISRDQAYIEVARSYISSDSKRALEMLNELQAQNNPASVMAATLIKTIDEGS